MALLRDYIESLAERGRTVPAAGKRALSIWADDLGVDWPLTNPLVVSAATVETNEAPKQAPSMDLETLKKIERLATNVEANGNKRAFAAGILLMTYAILRFSDVQRRRSLETNDDSVNGTLLRSKTKKPNGKNWPWACPRMGVTGECGWVHPILDLRTAYARVNGHQMTYTSPRLDRTWGLVAEGPSPYSTSRKHAPLCVGLGDSNGDSYTLHSPENLFPKEACQISFDQRELSIIGHWPSTAKIPERYDRSVCANELLLRNTIIQRMVGGWGMAPAFHLPTTVEGHVRIGKPAIVDPPQDSPPTLSPAGSRAVDSTMGGDVLPVTLGSTDSPTTEAETALSLLSEGD